MRIRKAVITAASPVQRRLPLQSLVDRDGREKSVLGILVEELAAARIEEIGVVICPGDADAYRQVVGDHAGRVRFMEQGEPRGYGHAVWCARGFTGGEPFLHLVSDHLYVSEGERSCAARLIAVAETEQCAVSAVQSTREGQLTKFGAVGGQRAGSSGLYKIDTVLEKPTPTEAEQSIIVPGLRAGHYLCFFGMHVLTQAVMDLLDQQFSAGAARGSLSAALAELARRERYLALEFHDRRYDLGEKYGLLNAQLALALVGQDRERVLSDLLETLAQRESARAQGARS